MGFQVALVVKNLPANAGKVRDTDSIPGQEDALEKAMAAHPSIHAWELLWTEELDGVQSMGSHRVRHNWALSIPIRGLSTLTLKSELVCMSNKTWHKWWYMIQKLGYKGYGASTLLLSCELWRHSISPVEKSMQRGTEASHEEHWILQSPSGLQMTQVPASIWQ